jgi:hypothetical protein
MTFSSPLKRKQQRKCDKGYIERKVTTEIMRNAIIDKHNVLKFDNHLYFSSDYNN